MSILQRQQHLIQQISAINDEGVLIMLEEDLNLHLNRHYDMSDDLSPEDLEELKALAEDDNEENTISHDEFMEFVNQWLTK